MKIDFTTIQLKSDLLDLWAGFHRLIYTKFKNTIGKTAMYGVPDILFQDRTLRSNRVLLPWKTIVKNEIFINQIETFYGGVCIEFVNYDIFNPDEYNYDLFNTLLEKIGDDGIISAIISFRTEDGDPGATVARHSFRNFKDLYTDSEYAEKFSPIRRKYEGLQPGKGDNSIWEGNLYISIKGGSTTDIVESHPGIRDPQLFNPALEYANEQVELDIIITLSYFTMHCYDIIETINSEYTSLKNRTEDYLRSRNYDEGNLLDYCSSHPALSFGNGELIDPIQITPMSIEYFKTSKEETSPECCHNEAANKDIFYFDSTNNYILSAARPTNFFWATKLSNMMQQNYNLDEYFTMEQERVTRRNQLLQNN